PDVPQQQCHSDTEQEGSEQEPGRNGHADEPITTKPTATRRPANSESTRMTRNGPGWRLVSRCFIGSDCLTRSYQNPAAHDRVVSENASLQRLIEWSTHRWAVNL